MSTPKWVWKVEAVQPGTAGTQWYPWPYGQTRMANEKTDSEALFEVAATRVVDQWEIQFCPACGYALMPDADTTVDGVQYWAFHCAICERRMLLSIEPVDLDLNI